MADTLHNSLTNHATDGSLHNLHLPGYSVADLTALNAISTGSAGDLAFVQSSGSYYARSVGGAWQAMGGGATKSVVKAAITVSAASDLIDNSTVTVSGSYAGTGDNTKDNNTGTYWEGNGVNATCKWDFGSAKLFANFSLWSSNQGGDYTTTFTVAGSNNDSDYTTFLTVSSAMTLGSWQSWSFDAQTWRYIKFTGTGALYPVINEAEVPQLFVYVNGLVAGMVVKLYDIVCF